MPPPFPSATGKVATAPRQAAELERIAADPLREETGRAPRLDALLANGYEAPRPCLPPATGRGPGGNISKFFRNALPTHHAGIATRLRRRWTLCLRLALGPPTALQF